MEGITNKVQTTEELVENYLTAQRVSVVVRQQVSSINTIQCMIVLFNGIEEASKDEKFCADYKKLIDNSFEFGQVCSEEKIAQKKASREAILSKMQDIINNVNANLAASK